MILGYESFYIYSVIAVIPKSTATGLPPIVFNMGNGLNLDIVTRVSVHAASLETVLTTNLKN